MPAAPPPPYQKELDRLVGTAKAKGPLDREELARQIMDLVRAFRRRCS